MKSFQLPIASVDLSGNEERYVVDALRSSWISSSGAYIDRFESEFARLVAGQRAIAVTNGTVALHLALLALGVGRGDEVIVPAFAFIAVANACRYVGAEPVFADADPGTWCLDPAQVERSITPRTRAIIVVHNYGHPADMEAILALARARGLRVVEDAAEAFGASYRGRPVGSLGDVGTFSFFANKIITSGEGGAIVLPGDTLEAKIRLLRDHGMDPARRYHFPITGYNYRITNLTCATLCAQLERSEAILARRREIFAAYRERLAGIAGVTFQPIERWAELAPWMFNVLVDRAEYGRSAQELAARLADDGIQTRSFFEPLPLQPPFVKSARRRGTLFPVAEALCAAGLSLPTFNKLPLESIDAVAESIRRHRG
ncbi:MAG: DegT/DnrJ/EryC1/StrS family aminotransferase [Myxococcaceae bacterium]